MIGVYGINMFGDAARDPLDHEIFIWRMMKPVDNEDLMNELLGLCAKIYKDG